jgi:hypothetical protein
MSAAATSAALSQITVAETDKPTPKPGLLTADQAAEALGCARATLAVWARDGQITRELGPDGHNVYDLTTVPASWLAFQRRTEGAARCALVPIIRTQAAPTVLWPGSVAGPPWGEGGWAEWVIERDALPAHACTPPMVRGGWSMAGQEVAP